MMPGQNTSGRKATSGGGGGEDRPGHALGRLGVGYAAIQALGHLPVGQFGDHDGTVHQQAHRHDAGRTAPPC